MFFSNTKIACVRGGLALRFTLWSFRHIMRALDVGVCAWALLCALLVDPSFGRHQLLQPVGEIRPMNPAFFGQGMGIFTRMEQSLAGQWVGVTYEDMASPAAACRVGQLRWPGGNVANCWNSTTNDFALRGTRGRTCQEYKGGQKTWEAHANSSLYSASSFEAAMGGVTRAPMVWDVNVLSNSGEGGYEGGGEAAAYQVEYMAVEEGVEMYLLELGNEFYRQAYALDFPDVTTYLDKVQNVMAAAGLYYPDATLAVPLSYSQLLSSYTDPSAPVYGTSTPAYYGIHAGLDLGLLATVVLAIYCWSFLKKPVGAVALLLVASPVAVFSGVLIIFVVHRPSQPASNNWAITVTHRLFGYLTYAVMALFSLVVVTAAVLGIFEKLRPRLVTISPVVGTVAFMALLLAVIFPTCLTGFLLVETDWAWYVAALVFLAAALLLAVAPPILRWRVTHPAAKLLPPSSFVVAALLRKRGYDELGDTDRDNATAQAAEGMPGETTKRWVVLVVLLLTMTLLLVLVVAFLAAGVFVSHAAPRPWNEQMQAAVEAREGGWKHFTVHDYGLTTELLTACSNSSTAWPAVVAAYSEAALSMYGDSARELYGNDSKIWMTEAGILEDQFASADCIYSTEADCFMTKAVNSNILQGLSVIGRILTAINDAHHTYETINTFKLQQVFGLNSSQDLGNNELFRFPSADDPGPYCTVYTQVWAHVAHVALDLSNSMQAINVTGKGGFPPDTIPVQVFGKSLPCVQATFFFNMSVPEENSTCSSFSIVAINRCQNTMLANIPLPPCFAALLNPLDHESSYSFQQTGYVYQGAQGPPAWVPCPDVTQPLPWLQPYHPQMVSMNITYLNPDILTYMDPQSLTVITVQI